MARKKRPEVLKGNTDKIKTGCGNLYLTLNQDDKGELYEVGARIGKSGSCARSLLEVISILSSIILQGEDRADIIKTFKKHLRDVNCGQEFREGDKRYGSCIDKIAQKVLVALKEE